MRRGHSDREDGFTLVEVLVAFAIISLTSLMMIRITGDIVANSRRVASAEIRLDEAEGIVLVRAAAGTLHGGYEQGRFSDGQPWTLYVVDVGSGFGWRNLPPLWHARLTLGGPDGSPIYTTLIAGGLSGG